MLRVLLSVVVLVGVVPAVAGDAAGDDGATLFEGMHRDAVAVLLGPPHKVKRSHGQETLIYTLRRVSGDYLPSNRERLVVLPGRGPCVARLGDSELDETLSIEPSRTDERGRPISGGPTSTLSRTVTLGDDERPDEPRTSQGKLGPKLKLKLVLAGDRVESWSATP